MKLLLRQPWRLWFSLVLIVALTGLLLMPSVHWPVYGWLRGEAFYQGMPTSWWVREIEESYGQFLISSVGHPISIGRTTWYRKQPRSAWERVQQRLNFGSPTNIVLDTPLLDRDLAAVPLLLKLVRGDSVKLRRVAISGLAAQGSENTEVVSALLEATKDPDDEVRQDAIAALKRLDPEAAAKAGVGVK